MNGNFNLSERDACNIDRLYKVFLCRGLLSVKGLAHRLVMIVIMLVGLLSNEQQEYFLSPLSCRIDK